MGQTKFNILKMLLIFLLTNLLFTSFWMFRTFAVVSISQSLTLLALDIGAGSLPGEVFRSYIEWAIVIPAAVTAIVCASAALESRGKQIASLATLCLLIPAFIAFGLKINFGYLSDKAAPPPSGGNIFDQYRSPAIPSSQGKSLNVIWIFVESLEKNYTDPAMNAELENATGFMTPLTVSPLIDTYTVGAVMSAKCGAPVFFTSALVFHLRNAGFNSATCFDDVLRHYGYQSYFVVGHDASLSGFRNYYQRHASAIIYDAKYLASRKVSKNSQFPTYPDETVFQTALGVLESPTLKKPFALNILTLDNHAPHGFPSTTCQSQYGTAMAAVIRCDNHFLAQFINELGKSGILRDTVLVVMGDHPFMGTFEGVSPSRDIFAAIYTPLPDKIVVNPTPSPFDFLPSVLSAMDFNVGHRQYGFGYSFYDVPQYPVKDWKSRLAGFDAAVPTEAYKALQK